jgi:hypothetical protein
VIKTVKIFEASPDPALHEGSQAIRDIFQENQAEYDMLVLSSIHVSGACLQLPRGFARN